MPTVWQGQKPILQQDLIGNMIPATADVKVSAISDAGAANVTAVAAVMGWFEPAPGV